jgi:hypothetical protein
MNNLSAKQVAERFMELWLRGDFRRAEPLLQKTWISNNRSSFLDYFKTWLGPIELSKYEIKEETINGFMTTINIEIQFTVLKRKQKKHINMNLIKEIAPYEPSANGDWGVNPVSCLTYH